MEGKNLQNYENPTYLVVKETKNGNGVFTEKDFKANEIILKMKGKIISLEEETTLNEHSKANTCRFSKTTYLSPEGLGDFINHSCNPNAYCKSNNGLYILAIDDISKGHEILIDYSTIMADDDEWTMKCNCGSINCRKIIKKFITLEKDLQNKYIKMGIVPDYIT